MRTRIGDVGFPRIALASCAATHSAHRGIRSTVCWSACVHSNAVRPRMIFPPPQAWEHGAHVSSARGEEEVYCWNVAPFHHLRDGTIGARICQEGRRRQRTQEAVPHTHRGRAGTAVNYGRDESRIPVAPLAPSSCDAQPVADTFRHRVESWSRAVAPERRGTSYRTERRGRMRSLGVRRGERGVVLPPNLMNDVGG